MELELMMLLMVYFDATHGILWWWSWWIQVVTAAAQVGSERLVPYLAVLVGALEAEAHADHADLGAALKV